MVDDDGKAQSDVLGQVGPHQRQPARGGPAAQEEPPLFDPSGPGHDHEQEEIDQHHAEIARDHCDEPGHEKRVAGQQKDRAGAADAPLLIAGALPGQHEDEEDLGHLGGLDVHRQEGKVQPAVVAGLLLAHAEGGEQQQDEEDVEDQHPLPGPLGEQLDIHEGHDGVGHHSEADSGELDGDEAGAGLAQIAGGAVDQHHAEQGGRHAQPQKHQVGFMEKFAQGVPEPHGHGPPFGIQQQTRIYYCTTFPPVRKPFYKSGKL